MTLLEFANQPECENCGTARKVEGLRKLMLETGRELEKAKRRLP